MSTGPISHDSSYSSQGAWPASSVRPSARESSSQVIVHEQKQQQINLVSKKNSYSVEIIASLIVVIVAIAVLVVALNIILPGIPQSIVVAISLSLVSLGGISALKTLVYKTRETFVRQDSEDLRVKHALGIGVAITGLGLAMKVSSVFIPGGYNLLTSKIGGSVYDKAGSSLLNTLSHYIYLKFYKSPKIDKGEELTSDELRIEAKKLKMISMWVLGVGVAFLVLGVLIAVSGHIFVTGVASTIMLAVASPLIAVSLSFILQTLLHSSIGQWRVFETALKEKQLLVEGKLSDVRREDWMDSELAQKPIEVQEALGSSTRRITSEEISKKIQFSNKQKIILSLATLLMLAGIALLCVSSFVPLASLYVYLMVSLGSTLTGVAMPVVSSGLVDIILQLRLRYRISKIRWKEAQKQASVYKEFKQAFGNKLSEQESLKIWNLVGRDAIKQTEKAIREEVVSFKKGKQLNALLIGSCFILCGIGIMLLSLAPILVPLTSGIIGIGGIVFTIGCAAYFRQFVIWLSELVQKLKKKREERRSFLNQVGPITDIFPQDLVVDALIDSDEISDVS